MALNYRSKLFGGGPGGGSGIGSSSDTQVLFNSLGTVAGDAGLTYDAGTDTLTSVGLRVAPGSAGAPSIGSTASPTSGIFFTGSATLFAAGSNVRHAFNYNGAGEVALRSDANVAWSSTTSAIGPPDSGLRRVSAGLVGVTSGGSNLGSIQAGNVTAVALATPAITSPLTVNGTPGVVTYGYKRVCFLNDGTSTAASAEVTVATGPATLGAVDNITVAWPAVTGEAYSEVYRTTGNGALGEAPPRLIYTGTAPTTIDVGAPGTSKVPATTNTTGRILVGDGSAGIFNAGSNRVGVTDGSGSYGGLVVLDFAGIQGNFGRFFVGEATPAYTELKGYTEVQLNATNGHTVRVGTGASATPVAQTLIVGESGAGTDIAGAAGILQSGAGTGAGAGSHLYLKTPTVHGSDAVAQTQTTRFDIYEGTTIAHTDINPATGDSYALGGGSTPWYKVMVSRATLGSKAKALTDGSATAFATFTIADGATYGGEVIYSVVATQGTAKQRLDGRARFSATREGSTYTVAVNEIGTQTLAAAAGTLTGAIEISGTAGVVTLSANFNTSQTPDTFVINPRFNSPDAGLALTFP